MNRVRYCFLTCLVIPTMIYRPVFFNKCCLQSISWQIFVSRQLNYCRFVRVTFIKCIQKQILYTHDRIKIQY